ncbi:unnamed protein product, partial [Symbiodinium sp. CCMP2456]
LQTQKQEFAMSWMHTSRSSFQQLIVITPFPIAFPAMMLWFHIFFVNSHVWGFKHHANPLPQHFHDAVQELTLAFPLVLQNLTFASGVIRSGDKMLDRSVIKYHPGNFQSDEEFVADKTAGFYAVLHDFISLDKEGKAAADACPHALIPNIMPCIKAASCVIQAGVPDIVDMEIYASMLEQMTRFEQILWPLLRDGLVHEKGGETLADDLVFPEAYTCDDSVHTPDDDTATVQVATALTQLTASTSSEHAATLAVAAAMHEATVASHQVLDAHGANSSMDFTIDKLQQSWHFVCQKTGCDPTNYWDIFFRHHEHSLNLITLGHPSLLRADIKMRFQLQHRVQRFIADNSGDFSFIQKFARMNQEQTYSWDVAVAYHRRNKEALNSFAMTVLNSLPESRTERLVDRQKLVEAEQELQRERSPGAAGGLNGTNQMSALQVQGELDTEAEEGVTGNSQWGRRRRRRRIWQAIVAVVQRVAKAIGSLLACLGDFGKFAATGYTRAFSTSTAGSIGLSAGNTNFLKDILGGKTPSGWISLDMGFSVGSTSEVWWAGSGFSGSLVCDTTGACSIYIAVSVLATGNAKTPWSPLCPMGPTWAGMDCSHCAGASVTILCCSFDLTNGHNTCR